MSEVKKDSFKEMMEQYEKNNAPRYEKSATAKEFSLTNYFSTFLPKGQKSGIKTIRILPTSDGGSPFIELHAHKAQIEGEWKTLPCLKHELNEPCPFCETREALLATGTDSDKELAKKFNARKMYVIKVIDRDNEADGVKFWRFNHDFRKEGVYDKIMGLMAAIKKDVTNADTGRDLVISINKNQNDAAIVSSIASLDPSPLSENAEQRAEWLGDGSVWQDVYATKNYEFLEIVVMGGVPVWDKEAKKFVDKNAVGKKEGKGNSDNDGDSEITMGIEDIKKNLKATEKPVSKEIESEEVVDEEDDLPF